VLRGEAGGHRFQRRPHLYHFDNFALRFTDDVDAAGDGANEPLLLEQRQGFTNWRAADAKRRGQLPLVQTQFLIRIIDVGIRDGVFQKRVGLIT